jgi:hypothetical protein
MSNVFFLYFILLKVVDGEGPFPSHFRLGAIPKPMNHKLWGLKVDVATLALGL